MEILGNEETVSVMEDDGDYEITSLTDDLPRYINTLQKDDIVDDFDDFCSEYGINYVDDNDGGIDVNINLTPLELEMVCHFRRLSYREQLRLIGSMVDIEEEKLDGRQDALEHVKEKTITSEGLLERLQCYNEQDALALSVQ